MASVTANPATITATWTDAANAAVVDAAVASEVIAGGATGTALVATAFGFANSIPATAKIVGVTVSLWQKNGDVLGEIRDSVVRLVVGGAAAGDDAAVDIAWLNDITQRDYGGATSLWGLTLEPGQVRAATFGVSVKARNAGEGPSAAMLDGVEVTIWYVPPGTPADAISIGALGMGL